MSRQPDRTQRLLGNTAVLAIAQVSGMAVSLLVTPYVLSSVGIENYGLWLLIGSVLAYVGLLQVGVGRGSIRMIAFHATRGEMGVVRRIVAYGVVWHLAAAVALTPVAFAVAYWVLPHVNVSDQLLSTARNVFLLTFAYVFFGAALRPMWALVVGLERLWMTSVATLASQLVYAAAIVVFLSRGAGIYALPGAAFVQTAFQGMAFYVTGRRLIGRVFGNPFALERQVRRELLRFGGWFQVTNLARVVNQQTDAILIAGFADVRSVGYYGIGSKIADLVRVLPISLLGPLLPAATGVHAEGDQKQIANTIRQGGRLVGLLTFGLAGFVVATSPLIMEVWLGRSYPHVPAIATLLVLAYSVRNLTGVGATVVAAIGKPRYQSEYAVLSMVLNIAATIALAPVFGLYGVVLGTVVGVVVSSVFFLIRFHRLMQVPAWEYLGTWLWRLALATTAAATPVFVVRLALPASVLESRGTGAIMLAVLGLLYVLLLLVGLRLVRFLGTRDLATIKRVLPARLQALASKRTVAFLFGGKA
jgi:O-antigen/teichoic acid export membrane protein